VVTLPILPSCALARHPGERRPGCRAAAAGV